ncbi:hypothetical protein [Anaerovorax sp. IOR16]|uniref:hypothetical protein n=1 Tax=Anaerovorax sp. IOR16 TaxID=2773458 RepID=UPI0019CF6D04|nr:hypothetical protein [Anaerovorax sp. IOR16]
MIYKNQESIPNEKYISYDQMNIINTFEKLWIRIAIWVRAYIRAYIYDTPNLSLTTSMLNDDLPSEVYDLFSIFFGTQVAETMKKLFFDFFKAIIEVVEPIKYGDEVLANSRIIKWYEVADEISSFLAKINVYWDENQWKYLLYQYIKFKIDEINAVIQGDHETEKKLLKELETINFLMSNYMARGIIFLAQNPNIYKKLK